MDALGGAGGMEVPNIPENPPMPQDEGDADAQDFDGMDDSMDDEMNPKKEIQQLTGKLSQALRNYNNDQEQPDEDLNKYVAGMIIPQASKALTDKGKKEVINKVKKGVTDEDMDADADDGNGEEEMDDIQMESKIYEIVNNVLDDFDDTKKTQKVSNKTLPKRSPFRSSR